MMLCHSPGLKGRVAAPVTGAFRNSFTVVEEAPWGARQQVAIFSESVVLQRIARSNISTLQAPKGHCDLLHLYA